MNVHEKTERLLNQILYRDLRTEVGVDGARKDIRMALKAQDRDTRHACAESIVNHGVWCDAVNTIMNCRGGME